MNYLGDDLNTRMKWEYSKLVCVSSWDDPMQTFYFELMGIDISRDVFHKISPERIYVNLIEIDSKWGSI